MESGLVYLGAALAVWLAWVWVALGQSIVSQASMEVLGKNPKLMSTLRVYTILWIALVESAMIYGLVIAFQILDAEVIGWMQSVSAWLAIWLTAFWAWYWEWKLVAVFLDAVNRNPDNKANALQFMILFLALVETVAIYGLIIALKILG